MTKTLTKKKKEKKRNHQRKPPFFQDLFFKAGLFCCQTYLFSLAYCSLSTHCLVVSDKSKQKYNKKIHEENQNIVKTNRRESVSADT